MPTDNLLTAVQLTADNANDPRYRQLYETAFPKEEQIPYDELLPLIADMPLDYLAWYDGDQFIGITMVYRRATTSWFWYFAVCEPLRGQGYGSHILTALLARYADQSLILDMESPLQEAPNSAQRHRRHDFYSRHGFRDTGVGRSFSGIDFTIMIKGEATFTMADYDAVLNELWGFWERKTFD